MTHQPAYTARHAHAEATSDYSYGDCERQARSAQDIEDALWADKEAFSEHVGERFGPLDYRPGREARQFRGGKIVPLGYVEEEITTGLRNIALAQAWRAAKPEDRDAIAAAFGKSVLEDLESYLAAKAADEAQS